MQELRILLLHTESLPHFPNPPRQLITYNRSMQEFPPDISPEVIAIMPNKDNMRKVVHSALKIWNVPMNNLSDEQGIAYDFFTKNILCSVSIFNIVNPVPSPLLSPPLPSNQVFSDFPSAIVLLRSLFEGYINMSYLFRQGIGGDLFDLKLALWRRHSLIELKKMTESSGFKGVGSFCESNEEKIKQLETQINSSTIFNSLSNGKKEKILKEDEWSLESTNVKAQNGGIPGPNAQFFYKYWSGYAHSTTYAIEQVSTINSAENAVDMMFNPIYYTDLLLTKIIQVYGIALPIVAELIKKDGFIVQRIKFWDTYANRDIKKMNKRTQIAN